MADGIQAGIAYCDPRDGCAAMSTCGAEDPAAAWSIVRTSLQRIRGLR